MVTGKVDVRGVWVPEVDTKTDTKTENDIELERKDELTEGED
ncbi:MAG: hypothetical protein Ta2F_03040 [Termitinemataceae bacterium]|nr:MAG: hypothetical protein Ta2F_03040 [Termitinemataceae bacterium]